jgi:hypothetical protein
MQEALMGENGDKQSAYAKIVSRAWSDPVFKRSLVANPGPMLAQAGIVPPPGSTFRIVEDTDTVTHLVLGRPPGGGELSDAALERVAGGISINPKLKLCVGG